MADWSELPSELLQQISQKLNYSQLYLLRFRSICSSWRRSSSLPNCHHNHLPSKLPQFSKKNNCVRGFSKHNIFLIRPPASATINQQGTLRPWLIRIGPDIHGKTQIWHPFLKRTLYFAHHQLMVDLNQLLVIHLGHMFCIHDHHEKVVDATCEVGQPLAVLTYDYHFDSMLKIFRCEDNSWMSIPTMPPRSLWGDICIFKGRPCVADKNGHTQMIEENLSIFLLANPVFGGTMKFLVESECDLLLVDCYGFDTSSHYDDDTTIRFDVFRLDEKEKKWVKLTTLGDRVLFVDREYSFSASASDLHVAKGNCIIFSRNSPYAHRHDLQSAMRIFHLNRDHVSRLSDYPDYINLFWPPPKWILDLHN